nr:NUMOD4 domain-containing protein [uncultured Cellulosilyticum sp.]
MVNLLDIQWKAVKGFENYEVSNKGQVRNAKTKKVLNPFILKSGDLQVTLYKHGAKTRRIARLVAEAFIDNPNNYKYIKHLDGNKKNNSSHNLVWCQMNELDFFESSITKLKKTNSKAIQMLDLQGNLLGTYQSIQECSYKTGFGLDSISECANGKVKQVYGKTFKFIVEDK